MRSFLLLVLLAPGLVLGQAVDKIRLGFMTTMSGPIATLGDRNRIDFLTGTMLSNQLLAVVKPVTDSGAIILSGIGGPSELAGEGCNPNVFVLSWENNTPSEAVGKAMTDSGKKRGFFVAQNYVTGKEHVAGAKSYFKGQVVGEAYPDRTTMDFASEISQIRS